MTMKRITAPRTALRLAALLTLAAPAAYVAEALSMHAPLAPARYATACSPMLSCEHSVTGPHGTMVEHE